MMDTAAIHQCECDIDCLIVNAHKSGLSYWWILRLALKAVEKLVMLADEEFYMRGGT